jgi:hypothetical protein
LKQQFINPFVWCIVDFNSCYNLVKCYDEIDFNKFELHKDENWNFSIIVDKIVKIQYVHYKLSRDYKELTVKGNDVYYNRIWEYIVAKYQKRIENVKSVEPIFLFATANNGLSRHTPFTLSEQKQIENLNSKYKIIFSFKDMIKSDKIITIPQDRKFTDNGMAISNFIFDRIHKLI